MACSCSQYPFGQACLGIAGQHRHGRLRQDRAFIHRLGDQMHRAAVQLNTCGERARVGVQAWKGGQQARMDVEHAALPGVDEAGRQQPHVAGKTDDFGTGITQRGVDCRFMPRAVVPKGTMGDRPRANTGIPCQCQACGIGLVGDDKDDLRRKRRLAGGSNECRHVGPAAADQDGGPALHFILASPRALRSARPPDRSRLRSDRCGRRSRPDRAASRWPHRRRRRPAPCRSRS